MTKSLSEKTTQFLDAVAAILLRCFIMTVSALLFVWIVIAIAGDGIYKIHNLWFDLPRPEYDKLLFAGLMFMKILNVTFFMIPYVAIKHYLRNQPTD